MAQSKPIGSRSWRARSCLNAGWAIAAGMVRPACICALLMAVMAGAPSKGLAASPFEEGRQIMEAVHNRAEGDNMSAELRMILVDSNEKRRVHKLRMFRKVFGEASFHLIIALEPEHMKNFGLLSYDYSEPGKSDDQWWHEPDQKKARRLAAAERSGSFMGSGFNYADLTKADLASFSYRLMKNLVMEGQPLWQIQVLPKSQQATRESGYSKSVLWVRKDNLVVVRAVHWEFNSPRIKHMLVTRLSEIGGIWMAMEIQMVTREHGLTEQTSILQFGNILFDQKLKKRLFTTRGLEKGLN